MSKTIHVNLLVWWPLFVVLNAINWHGLEATQGLTESQSWHFLLLSALNAAVLTLMLSVWDALAAPAIRRHCGWGVAVGAAAFVVFRVSDMLFFKKLGYHLSTGVRLVLENGLDQSSIMMEECGIRRADACLELAVLAGGVAGLAILLRATIRVTRRLAVPMKTRALVSLASGIFLGIMVYQVQAFRDEQWAKLWYEQERVLPFTLGWRTKPPGAVFRGAHLRSLGKLENRAGGGTKENSAPVPERTAAKSLPVLSQTEKTNLDQSKPDVFVFIVESLRGDIVDAETAPFMCDFQKDALPVGDSLAGGNATHLSWYSLFTGNYALRAGAAINKRISWKSIPLEILVNNGYKIHVLSGAHLHYYDLDNILFGEKLELPASLFDERHMDGLDRPARDRLVTQRLIEKISEEPGGRLFLIFYDSTHHDYYWPEQDPPRFSPITKGWGIYEYNISTDKLAKIKNRYRNSVYFVDSLFGRAITELKRVGRYKNSVVFLTGDHGEEFLEHGRLVHANEGCRVQTHVPWLLKLASDRSAPGGRDTAQVLVSHADFLPSLLDYLGLPPVEGCDGESIWRKRGNYAVIAEQNGSRDPYVFSVQDLKHKAWFRYRSWDVYLELESEIYLQKVTDIHDRPLSASLPTSEERRLATDILLSIGPRLFPTLAF